MNMGACMSLLTKCLLHFFEIYSSRKALIYKAGHEAIAALFMNKPDLNLVIRFMFSFDLLSGMVYTDSTDLSLYKHF